MAEGEFGMGIPPSKLMEETAYFFNVRAVVKDMYDQIDGYGKKR